jgi:hypothetical protein
MSEGVTAGPALADSQTEARKINSAPPIWVPMRLVLLMEYQGVAVNLYMPTLFLFIEAVRNSALLLPSLTGVCVRTSDERGSNCRPRLGGAANGSVSFSYPVVPVELPPEALYSHQSSSQTMPKAAKAKAGKDLAGACFCITGTMTMSRAKLTAGESGVARSNVKCVSVFYPLAHARA